MPKSYMPANDGQFSQWFGRFQTYLATNGERLGLTLEEVNDLDGMRITFDNDFLAHNNAHVAARVATLKKNESRGSAETVIRGFVNRIQASPACTDQDREALGITIRGLSAGTSGGALEWCDDRPEMSIDINSRLTHKFVIQNQTPEGVRRARPAGAMGCEVRMTLGDPPSDPSEMTMIGVATQSRYVVSFDGDDAGKTAHYAMRWINAKGEKGPWSETESATIAA